MNEINENHKNDIVNNIYFKEIINDYHSIDRNNNPFLNNIIDIFESSIKKELTNNKILSTNVKEEFKPNKIENKICLNESNNKINSIDNFSISNNSPFISGIKNINNNEIIKNIKEYLDEKLTEFKENFLKGIDSLLKRDNKNNSNLQISCFNFSYYNKESLKNLNQKRNVPQIEKKKKKRNYSETNSSKSDFINSFQGKNDLIENFFKKIPKN